MDMQTIRRCIDAAQEQEAKNLRAENRKMREDIQEDVKKPQRLEIVENTFGGGI